MVRGSLPSPTPRCGVHAVGRAILQRCLPRVHALSRVERRLKRTFSEGGHRTPQGVPERHRPGWWWRVKGACWRGRRRVGIQSNRRICAPLCLHCVTAAHTLPNEWHPNATRRAALFGIGHASSANGHQLCFGRLHQGTRLRYPPPCFTSAQLRDAGALRTVTPPENRLCVAIGFEPEIVPSSADHHQTLTLELKLSSQQIDFYSVAVLLLLCGILLVLCYCVAHVCKLWQEVVAQYKDSMHVPARHARRP